MLEGRTIVVGGGTGDVGVGIVAELTGRGASVIVPARRREKAEALLASVDRPDRVAIVEAPVDEDAAARMRALLHERGPIDGAVASLGSWFAFGRLVDTPAVGFESAWRSLVLSHFLFAKAVVPLLGPGARYVVVNGAGSETPVPQSSAVSIHAHGLSMLFETLRAEHPALRVHMLMLRSVIATRARPDPDPRWITAHEVGAAAAWLFTEEGALSAGSVLGLQARHVEAG